MVVLPRVPYPLDKGDKLRAYHMLRELSRQFKIFLCCVAEGGNPFEAKATLLEFCEEVHIYPLAKMQSLLGAAQCIFTGEEI